MGFMDKVKASAQQVAAEAEKAVKQGQEKLEDVQAKKKADGLLRDLGAWYYAAQTGRDDGKGPGELARITAELQAHEAQNGPLGGAADEPEPVAEAPAAPTAPPVAPPPPSMAPPPPGSVPPPPPGAVPPPPSSTF